MLFRRKGLNYWYFGFRKYENGYKSMKMSKNSKRN